MCAVLEWRCIKHVLNALSHVDGINYMVIVARINFPFLSVLPIGPIDIEGRSRVPMVISSFMLT